MKRKVKRPFDNEQFRKGYVAGIFAAEKELNTKLLHFAEKAHEKMSEGTFPDYGIKINFKDSNNTIATNLVMTTEKEKAKKYDEALEWMRGVYPTLTGAAKEDAEHYFPELKEESEDERIRKFILEVIKAYDGMSNSTKEKCISYLEKQKEQKSADVIDPFSNANFVRGYESGYADAKREQKPAEWSEEDEKMMNLIKTQLRILQSHLSHAHSKSMSDMEYSSRLLQIEKGVSWLDIRLKSLRPQPKVKWSEEDEKMLLSIINAFRNGSVSTIGQEQWLKLLPERFNLQPSLEHLQKEKVYDIMAKLTNLSYSNLIPFNSEEYKKINEITSDVFDLLKYPVEKK